VSGTLLLVGVLLLVLGSLLPVVAPMRLGLWAQAAGVTLLGIAGAIVLWSGDRIGARFSAGLSPAFGIDRLSGVYLVMLGLVSGPVLVFASGYLEPSRRGRAVAASTGLFVVVLVGLVCARDVVSFLVSWELMTLVPAAIILIWHADLAARRTVFVYAAVTHLAGAGVWVSLLVLAERGALSGHALAASSSTGVLVSAAALVGFGAKAGVVPLHVWLPRAHPIAPAPVSALMSGVMLNVALYGLMRVLMQWLAGPSVWLGIVVVALGAVSALVGILGALFQGELKRLLAFSSIENVGIVLLGLGAALVLRSEGNAAWASIAFAAALLHMLNHAFFKALLFLAAGSIDSAVHGLDLNRLGGLLRVESVLQWTSAGFSKPVRLVLEVILRPEREIVTTTRHGIVQSVSYQGRMPLLIDEHVYAPVQRLALGGAAFARRLQSGRLGAYVGYLIGLVVALLLCARIGVLG
jgi:hydrogenase-4 component B